MKIFLQSAGLVLFDLASTLLFLIVFLLTSNLYAAVISGMVLGVAQLLWELWNRRPIEALQAMSLVLVLASGTAALVSGDARLVMIKPSVVYALIGFVMLKRGWMMRYLPPVAQELLPDVAVIFGYLWAALMLFSAVLNLVVAPHTDALTWAAFMSVYAIASKVTLFVMQFAVMRLIGRQRRRVASQG
ncbi:inner membrane-spanning protein YciB [Pseudorhodobacter sp.]|uniref:inner membrane-spanning protein YciB n=1 Tax=Pseudorhodobacter sp. TaxID=1934400 RepID=UPI0026475CBE|nr:septation protein IspZ [Pseudorhodobacter sp.]MDN5787591.1 septation protein IspZ [Pseudorhodobacter sp.]